MDSPWLRNPGQMSSEGQNRGMYQCLTKMTYVPKIFLKQKLGWNVECQFFKRRNHFFRHQKFWNVFLENMLARGTVFKDIVPLLCSPRMTCY